MTESEIDTTNGANKMVRKHEYMCLLLSLNQAIGSFKFEKQTIQCAWNLFQFTKFEQKYG